MWELVFFVMFSVFAGFAHDLGHTGLMLSFIVCAGAMAFASFINFVSNTEPGE